MIISDGMKVLRHHGVDYVRADEAGSRIAEHSRIVGELQARIDALMLEYCPDEMTAEQCAVWADAQRPEAPQPAQASAPTEWLDAEQAIRNLCLIAGGGTVGQDQAAIIRAHIATQAAELEILRKQASVPEWQQIESAPRDGSSILLGFYGDGPCNEGHWMGNASRNHWGETGWFFTDANVLCDHPLQPDCWMPLPAAPTAADSGDAGVSHTATD